MKYLPLASSLLVARISANSDNSLSKLLGAGSMDWFMNLEQQEKNDATASQSQLANALAQDSQPAANEIEGNKIHYSRHSSWDEEDDSSEESSDDCPECFTSMGEGLVHEWGDRGHRSKRDYSRKVRDNIENMHHHRKDGVGESIMQDQPIRSGDAYRGHSSMDHYGTRRSFNFDDMRKSSHSRHFETKGHRPRHDNY